MPNDTLLPGRNAPLVFAQATSSLPPELTTSIAYYATLTSYADSGTVTVDTGGIVDKPDPSSYGR